MREYSQPSYAQKKEILQLALQTAINETARVREKRKMKQKPWEREHRNVSAYDTTFFSVLPEGITHTLRCMKAQKAPGEKLVVIDIMGTGSVFNNLPADATPDVVFALTLVDYRTPEEKAAEEAKGIFVIGTNEHDLLQRPTSVALPSTWKQLEKLYKEKGVEAIDFAVARPLGGMYTIPSEHLWYVFTLANNVVKKLKPGGIFLTEAPRNQNETLLKWAQIPHDDISVACRLIADDKDFQPPRAILKITKNP